jgi:hypothetical protein
MLVTFPISLFAGMTTVFDFFTLAGEEIFSRCDTIFAQYANVDSHDS